MQKDKKEASVINIGLSSLMVVFLVLCLTTFTILSLSSAKSDHTLSEKLASHKTAYYEASNEGEVILDQIDTLLEETYLAGEPESYLNRLADRLKGYKVGETEITFDQTEDPVISYVLPVEKGILTVRLAVTDPISAEYYYEILSWQTSPDASWEGDDSLNLMQTIED